MHTETCNIKEAIAAATRAKLDYVKINKQMSDMLQDVEDIMMQQVSDVFQLSSWVSSIISMFGLKVCNEQEWEFFNRHFNHETGKITASTTSKTIYMPYNNTTMTKVNKDELSKTHAELAMAHTTIKNLSEVVVNFSHTSNVLTTQQEVATPMPQPSPMPQPTLKQTTPQVPTPPTTQWVNLANPMVIKPTQNANTNPQQTPKEAPTKPKANPHQLILQFNPPIMEPKHKNADLAHKEINMLLDSLEVPTYF